MIEVEHDAGPHSGEPQCGVEQHNGENEEQNSEVPVGGLFPLPFLAFWEKDLPGVLKHSM